MEGQNGGANKDDSRRAASGPRVHHQACSENASRSITCLGIRTQTDVVGRRCSVQSRLTRMTEGTRP